MVFEYGRRAVAKVPFPSTPDSWIRHESVYADAVHACGAPVPQLRGLETIEGRTVSVWDYVDGDSLWASVSQGRFTPESAGDLLAGLHATLLSIVAPVSLPRQRDRLVCKVRRSPASMSPSTALLVDTLVSGETGLCHGDFHPGNVLLSDSGPMVIDWFDACRGELMGDVARTAVLLAPESELAHLPGAAAPVVRALRDRYLEAMGVAPDRTEGWQDWLAITQVAQAGEG